MKRIKAIALYLLLISLILTACGGASDKTAVMMTQSPVAMAPAAGGAGVNYKEDSIYEETEIAMDAVNMESGSSLATSGGITPQENIGRKLIRTIHLDVETDTFDVLLDKLQEQIEALNGYVEQSDISGHSIQYENSRRRAHMTVRIPSTKLDQFVTSMEENSNITNKSETTTDITLKYSDLESRKKSLTIEQDRIWALLEKADTLEAVIALEERLSEIRYELESMESKLRVYDNQVDYSTVYLNISEVKVYTPTAPATIGERIQKGFTRNIENMKDASIDFIVWLASSTPLLIPLLGIIFVLIIVIRKFISKKKIKNIASNVTTDINNQNETK